MIVSASYRTDIPAYYGQWFQNRFLAGFARVINPYGGPPGTVPLRMGVDGFVFWSRNPRPFLPVLRLIRQKSYPFYVQFTITGQPRAVEPAVIRSDAALDMARQISRDFGPSSVVWRYDPILISSLTPWDWHRRTFCHLAQSLAGYVDEVVFSFAHIYPKSARKLTAAGQQHRFRWVDPSTDDKRAMAAQMVEMAGQYGLRPSLCCQPDHLVPGLNRSACINARRLEAVSAHWGERRLIAARAKGNRPGCQCHESRDIGAYESCPQGCAYCYANSGRDLAKRHLKSHDPQSEYLFTPKDAP